MFILNQILNFIDVSCKIMSNDHYTRSVTIALVVFESPNLTYIDERVCELFDSESKVSFFGATMSEKWEGI